MKRLIDFLAPLGLVLILGSRGTLLAGKTLPGKADVYWIVGLALILAHVILRWETVVRLIGRRQFRYGGNMIVLSLVVLAILVGVNYIVARRAISWDLTKGQRYTLSDQTQKVARGLSEDIKITYFQRSGRPELEAAQDRLRRYQDLSSRIKVEYVDPVKKPALAEAHDIRPPLPVLIVERGTNLERITSDSEESITNALIKVTRSGKKTVCFVEGEGERDIDDFNERGFSQAKSALEKSQYETKKTVLLREKKVPEDCTVLAVTGPQKDLLPQATDAIGDFVAGGGKALVMVEPEFKESYPNLSRLVDNWNVRLGNDVVVDVSGIGGFVGTGPLTPVALEYPFHEITRDFKLMTAFHTARSVEKGDASPEGVTAQNIAETAPQAWAETDLSLSEPVEQNLPDDESGPISLAVAVKVQPPSPEPSPTPEEESEEADESDDQAQPEEKKEGRVVVFGDVDFASNALLGFQGNKDFFLNSVAWLAEDVDLISIRPKQPEDQRLFLTRSQSWMAKLLALVLLPGLFIALGVVVWWLRR